MQQLPGRAAEGHGAHLQHVGTVGHLEGGARVLLDQQHRDAVVAQAGHDLQHLAHDQRRQAKRGLVQQQQARARHQRAADGQHLALAARQGGGHLRAPLPQAREDGEDLVHALRLVAQAPAPAREAAQQQVVLHRHLAEQLALFGHQGHAVGHHDLDAGACDALAVQMDLAARGQQAHGGRQQRGLACAVGADDGDDLAAAHIQIHLVHRLHGTVGHAQALELQKGVAHAVSPVASSSSPPPR